MICLALGSNTPGEQMFLAAVISKKLKYLQELTDRRYFRV